MSKTRLALAEAGALAARARLSATLETLQTRLDPKTVARNATKDIVDSGEKAVRASADAVMQNPGKTAGIATVVGIFLARKTLLSAFRKRREK